MECLAIVVQRNHSRDLLAERVNFRVAQWVANSFCSQLELVTVLLCLDADLPFVIAVEAKGHPHHTVEAALVTVPETH
jgi:hypothetical protein